MRKTYSGILLVSVGVRIFMVICFGYGPPDYERDMEGHDPRKFKSDHRTSIFVALQSTNAGMTTSCEKSWLRNADDYYIFTSQLVKKSYFTEAWTVNHFSKLLTQTYLNMPHQTRWILFTFDDAYYFIDRIVKELSLLDSHKPIYSIVRDTKAKSFHRPAVIMSRRALDLFYEQSENCEVDENSVEDWLQGCLKLKPTAISTDSLDKSRCFAFSRHFEIDEIKLNPGNYTDGFSFINKHSPSLISFTNLTQSDLLLLPILIERIHGGAE